MLGSPTKSRVMFQQIDAERGQRPDILISNAGHGKRIPDVSDISLEEFDYSTRLAEYNISVNDIAPAMIGDTGMLSSAAAFPEVVASVPLKRLGTPEETANVVIMLAKTGYMTGQSLLLAGGLK
ncbi:3-ketoacyl-acyl carrier protein reductase [Penicillium sp. IBT 31633x]|nr:3-ketoacyl-acyl carrier protein reductase [Penicillium sp. IBT 31633x]